MFLAERFTSNSTCFRITCAETALARRLGMSFGCVKDSPSWSSREPDRMLRKKTFPSKKKNTMLQALISFWLLAIQPSNDAIPSIAKGTKYIKPFKIMLGRYPVTIEFKPGLQDNRKITCGIIMITLSDNWIIILIRSFWHLHKLHSSRWWKPPFNLLKLHYPLHGCHRDGEEHY